MYICHMLWLLLSWQQTTNTHTHTHTNVSNNAGNPREFTNYQSCLSRWAQNTKAQLIFIPYTVAARPQGIHTNLRTLLRIYWKSFQFSSTNSFYIALQKCIAKINVAYLEFDQPVWTCLCIFLWCSHSVAIIEKECKKGRGREGAEG